ncbi:hypothetical protein [Verrucomicrobium spinosum]|uniref:hypothetical protein n=1 Tax=Verrucomicrobium spinosum TaxID=2736 RepID=UPI0009463058|nr:hypothetical protein [Verrucomicrobium spinosum]
MKNVIEPDPAKIAHALEAWFAVSGRDYPWRRTTDPYAILVSEMMLQQTQISTVLDRGYYARWMERFPNTATLAVADEAEVLRVWEGLGYYRRARFLQQMAQRVESEHGGIFPATLEGVRALPGVGDYTAGAVCSFAHDAAAPIVDGNVHGCFPACGTMPPRWTAGRAWRGSGRDPGLWWRRPKVPACSTVPSWNWARQSAA